MKVQDELGAYGDQVRNVIVNASVTVTSQAVVSEDEDSLDSNAATIKNIVVVNCSGASNCVSLNRKESGFL